MKRAVTYARVSGDDTRKDGLNLHEQLEKYREYCQEKGYTIIAELAEDDRGASGADLDLPQLNRALEMARAGEFDVFVTREIDRLARSLAKQLIVEREFKQHGVEIEYTLAQYDDTPEGRLNKHIRATIAEFERELITRRTKEARRAKVRAGSVLTHGNAPFGYSIHKDGAKTSLAIKECEAEVVRMIFESYTGEDEPSISEVARRMTGTPTCTDLRQSPSNPKIRKRGQWSASSVSNILGNEVYTGTWFYAGDESLSVDVPSIISQRTWQRTQERKRYNKRFSKRNGKHEYLMDKRVGCTCGSSMICRSRAWGEKRYHYYACNARLYAVECDASKYWRSDHVDARVWDWIENDLFGNPQRLADLTQEFIENEEKEKRGLIDRVETVNALITENRQKLERLLGLYLESDSLTKEWLDEKREQLDNAYWGLEQELSHLDALLRDWYLFKTFYEEIAEDPERWKTFIVNMQARGNKKEVIEKLDVQAILLIDNGEQKIHVRCNLGEKVLSVIGDDSRTQSFNGQAGMAVYSTILLHQEQERKPQPLSVGLLIPRSETVVNFVNA